MKLSENGFIKPNGCFICLKALEHEKYLENHKENGVGWIKTSVTFAGTYILFEDSYSDFEPTQAQLNILFEWAKKFKELDKYNIFISRY